MVGDRLWIRGIESGGLIEPRRRDERGMPKATGAQPELGVGRGRDSGGRPAGKIEVGEVRANKNGIGNEGDDALRLFGPAAGPVALRRRPRRCGDPRSESGK